MRPRGHQLGVEYDAATGGAVILEVRPQIEHALPHQYETLDHPIERTAVEQFGPPARRLQCAMAQLGRLPFPRQALQPLVLPLGEILHRVDADAKFDEMHRHVADSMRHE